MHALQDCSPADDRRCTARVTRLGGPRHALRTRRAGPILVPLAVLVTGCQDTPFSPVGSAPEVSAAVSIAAGTWSPTGSMTTARRDHTATLLSDGTVLVVGYLPVAAELYDPALGTYQTIASPPFDHGQGATATRLFDGTVLIVGGNRAPMSAEIYHPSTRAFTAAGPLNANRSAHTATLLADGRVLIAGGQDPGPLTHASVEIYDPTTGTFVPTGSLQQDRASHGATLLPDGRVLVVGGLRSTSPGFGVSLRSAEIYDPATGAFVAAGSMLTARAGVRAVLLPTGKVLVLGSLSAAAELFDPVTGTFGPTGSMATPHGSGAATLLSDGSVLVSGGYVAGGPVTTAAAERYDPGTGTFTAVAAMNETRQQHTATLLADGHVLVAGGYSSVAGRDLASAEIYFASALSVSIDIAPGSDMNSVNCSNGRGVIPVAILSTVAFDATSVDHSTVTFEGASETHVDKATGLGRRHEEDVDQDGDLDLVFHFRYTETSLTCSSTNATLMGATFDGRLIEGNDAVRMVAPSGP